MYQSSAIISIGSAIIKKPTWEVFAQAINSFSASTG
jgi:hypothetical protein